ncbi:MAG: protein phosphatase CheZ [Deltaproteobacteria bacterium]|jgi:chemotaxis protein CheZ|nr:protein phosphatase CheZ [Deltaproteobacteria bacterium]
MARKKSLSRQIIDLLKQPGLESVPPDVLTTIRNGLQDHLDRQDQETAFHRRLSEDMLSGLHNIYKEIAKISGEKTDQGAGQNPDDAAEASAIFREASRQLDEIMTTTLNAADDIMNLAESIQDNQSLVMKKLQELKASGKIDEAGFEALAGAERRNMEAVSSIVTALSFQDLTGQRIKKVVTALSSVHRIVVETYISAGLMLKKTEEEPEKDFAAIEKESRQQAEAAIKGSELKGPSLDSNQKDVDDLLARLGL